MGGYRPDSIVLNEGVVVVEAVIILVHVRDPRENQSGKATRLRYLGTVSTSLLMQSQTTSRMLGLRPSSPSVAIRSTSHGRELVRTDGYIC